MTRSERGVPQLRQLMGLLWRLFCGVLPCPCLSFSAHGRAEASECSGAASCPSERTQF